jgi:predicted ester cyclase
VRNGKPVEFYVFDVCRFKDGRLIEHWGVPDRFALLHQAGTLPIPDVR